MSRTAPPSALPLDLLCCPGCGGALREQAEPAGLSCASCRRTFGVEAGVPLLFLPNEWDGAPDVTARIRSFYEQTPFPDYDDLDSTASLKEKARLGLFARMLDDQIPAGARIFDAGCGTGQLGNFLALSPERTVVAADLCLGSLRLAHEFKVRNRIDGVTFAQMNLFRPAVRPASFDLVISNGVLHHTSAPQRGFRALARIVRPGGFILIGLYNAWGRLPSNLRRWLFRLGGDRLLLLDPRLRGATLTGARRRAWFNDQYRNPHESKHTIGEVLAWFDGGGFDFVNAIPKTRAFAGFSEDERLFEETSPGSRLDHLLAQMGMLFSRGGEGGLFVMIGRRRGSATRQGEQYGGTRGR